MLPFEAEHAYSRVVAGAEELARVVFMVITHQCVVACKPFRVNQAGTDAVVNCKTFCYTIVLSVDSKIR